MGRWCSAVQKDAVQRGVRRASLLRRRRATRSSSWSASSAWYCPALSPYLSAYPIPTRSGYPSCENGEGQWCVTWGTGLGYDVSRAVGELIRQRLFDHNRWVHKVEVPPNLLQACYAMRGTDRAASSQYSATRCPVLT
eukprot:575257-Rhodomonas_salina.1